MQPVLCEIVPMWLEKSLKDPFWAQMPRRPRVGECIALGHMSFHVDSVTSVPVRGKTGSILRIVLDADPNLAPDFDF